MGRKGLSLVEFEGQIAGEAVTRMYGRHQMISLGDLISYYPVLNVSFG